jgi:hypothetical protein
MANQHGKTDISQELASKLSDAPAGRRLGVRFSPAVAFAVRCKPANAKLADKQHEDGRRSVDEIHYLAANLPSNSSESPGNADATDQA